MLPFVGTHFIRDVKAKGRPLYMWTVNEQDMMRWCIKRDIDGVITDDPKRFLEVCDEWERGMTDIKISWRQWMMIAWINFMVFIFGTIFWWKYRSTGKENPKRKRTALLPVVKGQEAQ